MSRFPACPFWDFSIAVYARDGVPPACLSLQERRGADVNLLLFCCWVGESGRGVLTAEGLKRASAAVERWHDKVVRGLRAVRCLLKREPQPAANGLATPLRKHVGAAELEAEHIEQLILAEHGPPVVRADAPLPERATDAARNGLAYLASFGPRHDAQDREDLLAVLSGCFPELGRPELEAALVAAGG